MILLKIVGIGLISAVCAIILKQIKPEFSLIVSMVGGILILIEVVDLFTNVLTTFENLSQLTGVDKELFSVVLKIIGIGYLTSFTTSLCNDAGMSSIGEKVMLGGKVVIMVVSLPIINSLIEIIMRLVNV